MVAMQIAQQALQVSLNGRQQRLRVLAGTVCVAEFQQVAQGPVILTGLAFQAGVVAQQGAGVAGEVVVVVLPLGPWNRYQVLPHRVGKRPGGRSEKAHDSLRLN